MCWPHQSDLYTLKTQSTINGSTAVIIDMQMYVTPVSYIYIYIYIYMYIYKYVCVTYAIYAVMNMGYRLNIDMHIYMIIYVYGMYNWN